MKMINEESRKQKVSIRLSLAEIVVSSSGPMMLYGHILFEADI